MRFTSAAGRVGEDRGGTPPDPRRLVVLVPDADANDAELARRIWDLASPRVRTVLLLGIFSTLSEEPRARRRLSGLAAATRGDEMLVETRLCRTRGWADSVKAVWRPGDVVVVPAEARVGRDGEALSQSLSKSLGVPVWTVSGLYPSLNLFPRRAWRLFLAWVLPLLVIGGFFLLQVQLDRISPDWARDVLLSLSVLLEITLIWVSQLAAG